jgi:hypothetical protein
VSVIFLLIRASSSTSSSFRAFLCPGQVLLRRLHVVLGGEVFGPVRLEIGEEAPQRARHERNVVLPLQPAAQVENSVDLGQEAEKVRAAVDVRRDAAAAAAVFRLILALLLLLGKELFVLTALDLVEQLLSQDRVEQVLEAEGDLLRRGQLEYEMTKRCV